MAAATTSMSRCAGPVGLSSKRHCQIRPFRHQMAAVRRPEIVTTAHICDGALAAAAAAAASLALVWPGSVLAAEKVGEFEASGFLFKDTVEVNAVTDEMVPGVTLYISDFKRSLADKLSKDFFTEPSQASLTCALTGARTLPANLNDLGGTSGKEVFSEKKNLSLFNDKTLRVRRIYDRKHNTLIYVSYSTRVFAEDNSTSRYRTSICTVPLNAEQPVASALTESVPAAVAGP